MHVNEEKRQVVIWATSRAIFWEHLRDGGSEEEWGFKGEYVFILDFDEQGKIKRVFEFLDSLKTADLRGLMGRAREVQRKLGGGVGKSEEGWKI